MSLNRNIEGFLSGYFTSKDLAEYKRLISETIPDKEINSADNPVKLKKKISTWEKHEANIDILITFAKRKLPEKEFQKMLVELGEKLIFWGDCPISLKIFQYVLKIIKDEPLPKELTTRTYLSLQDIYEKCADWDLSIKYTKKALKIFKINNNYKDISRAENIIGGIETIRGNIEKAKKHFEKSINTLKSEEDDLLAAKYQYNLVILNYHQGNFDIVCNLIPKILEIFVKHKEIKSIVLTKHLLALIFLNKGEYDRALLEIDEGIALSQEVGYLLYSGLFYITKANILQKMRKYQLANFYINKGMRIYSKSNDRIYAVEGYKIKGIIERKIGNYNCSEYYLQTALRIYQENHEGIGEAHTYFELGKLYKEMKKLPDAHNYFLTAYKYFKKLGMSHMKKKIEELLWNQN